MVRLDALGGGTQEPIQGNVLAFLGRFMTPGLEPGFPLPIPLLCCRKREQPAWQVWEPKWRVRGEPPPSPPLTILPEASLIRDAARTSTKQTLPDSRVGPKAPQPLV